MIVATFATTHDAVLHFRQFGFTRSDVMEMIRHGEIVIEAQAKREEDGE